MLENFDGYEVKQYGRITPRDYQQAAIDRAIEHCKTSRDPAVLDISVGGGKTIIIGALAKHVSDRGGSVLMLTRQSIICEQNSQDAWLCDVKNSIYSAGLNQKRATYNVIFGTEGTVYNALQKDRTDEPSELINFKPNLLLIDECHHFDWMADDCQYSIIIKELYNRNPKMKVIGLTGTSYRSTTAIIGTTDDHFWKKKLIDISTEYLTKRDFLVPVEFGFSNHDTRYDLDEFTSTGEDGVKDFSRDEMRKMENRILSAETTTEKIILEVVEKTKSRNGVMICVTGKRHMKEAAKFLPFGSYAMITDDTPERERNRLLKEVYEGKKKFILQINALSTGYNCPVLDTLVILRKYGSLTLLVQTVGRVLRLLKDEQKNAGIVKTEALVLDYTDTFAELGELYFNPMLEDAQFSRAQESGDMIQCPKCSTENGQFAVRCRGESTGERCDFFWRSRLCEDFYVDGRLKQLGCKAENAPTARECRKCANTLIDYNANLSRKHYTANDYKPVLRFDMNPTKNDGFLVSYEMPNGEVARVFYNPFSRNQVAKRIFYNKFVRMHCTTASLKNIAMRARNAGELCAHKEIFDTVDSITHRVNSRGDSIITKHITRERQ